MHPESPWLPENPWHIREGSFPETGSPAQKLQFLLNYAMLAPSIYNTQPWHFRVVGDAAELLVDPQKALLSVDPSQRQAILSCGAALEILLIALRHFLYDGQCKIFPDPLNPQLIAHVNLGNPTLRRTPDEDKLFMAIKKRRTYRAAFKSIPLQIPESLVETANKEGVTLRIYDQLPDKRRIGDLTQRAELMLLADSWVREQRDQWSHVEGTEGVPSFVLPAENSTDDSSEPTPDRTALYDTLIESPALLVMLTKKDNPINWVRTGRALSLILLQLCNAGASVSFVNQAVEIENTRRQLAAACSMPLAYPQIVLRAGYPTGHASETVPRTPLREKLIE